MADLTSVVKEGLSFCREVEAVQHERYMFDLGAPKRWQEQIGFGIRVNHLGRLGFAWCEGQYSLSELLQQAAQNSANGPEGDLSIPRQLVSQSYKSSLSIDDSISALDKLVQELRFILPSFMPGRSFTINAQLVHDVFAIANRRGVQRDERIAHLLTLRSPQNPPILATSYTTVPPTNPDYLLCQLLWRHSHSRDIALPDNDTLPAFFSPEASAQFWHDCLQSHWIDGEDTGCQPFPCHPSISVYEDGSLPRALGFTHIDGVGLPRQRLPLINQGQTVNTLRDAIAAKRPGHEVPGCAIRYWGHPPQTGYANLDILPGQHTASQLCQDMVSGIWLDYLTPLPAPAPAGIFQRRASIAFLVQNGRPIARLPQFVVQGNYRDMLNQNFLGLGCEARLHGRIKAPAMAVSELQLYKKELSPQESGLDLPGLWW
ncbi:MAG: metallopeptidase TldD-related protein [bacterium]|nr:metallopeptidase TldD-related protein [bacterium]